MNHDYPVFAVGDKVRIADPAGIRPRAEADEEWNGDIGFVSRTHFGKVGTVKGRTLTTDVYDVEVILEDGEPVNQAIHAEYLTLVEETAEAALEADLEGIVPEAESHVDYSDIDDLTVEPEDITVEQNDQERGVSPVLTKAILTYLKPGTKVRVVEGKPRVFMADTGKAEVVYLRPGETVEVLAVGDDADGEYLPERTIKVERGDGVPQWVDVTSLHPLDARQQEEVYRIFRDLAGSEEAATREIEAAHSRAMAAIIGKALGLDLPNTEKHEMTREENDTVNADEFLKMLGLDPKSEQENAGLDLEALAESRDTLETLEANLPKTPIARRMGVMAYAKEVASMLTDSPSPHLVVEVARFLMDDDAIG